jgi:hypothetical protein
MISALCGVWLVAALSWPGGLHACGAGEAAAAASPTHTHEHANHGGAAATETPPASDQAPRAGTGDCHCIGTCCAVTVIAAAGPAVVTASESSFLPAPIAHPATAIHGAARLYRQPFPNGPPSTRAL